MRMPLASKAMRRRALIGALGAALLGALAGRAADGVTLGPAPVAVSLELMDIPLSARGPHARTLLVYTAARLPYTLADVLEMAALRLRRVAGDVSVAPMDQVTSNQLAGADYVVVFCPEYPGELPMALTQAMVARTNQPFLWVGSGMDRIQDLAPLAGSFRVRGGEDAWVTTNVTYRGRDWMIPPTQWVPVELGSAQAAGAPAADAGTSAGETRGSEGEPGGDGALPEAKAEGEAAAPAPAPRPAIVHMAIPGAPGAPARPVCWSVGSVMMFSSLPWEGMTGHLFGDVLLDFYGVTNVPASRLLVRLEGYHARSDHERFRRLTDFLHARRMPFAVAIVPDSGAEEASLDESFVESVRYAQRRGGRMILRGYRVQEDGEAEFWNRALDRPLALNPPAYARERLTKGLDALLGRGVLPLAWSTPDYAASTVDYREIAKCFSTGVERVQLSDATALERHTPATPTRDRFGRVILPENLGRVTGREAAGVEAMMGQCRELLRLRGVVACAYFDLYLPFDALPRWVSALESLEAPFMDLARMSHWVRWPGGVLLTGRAERKAVLLGGPVQWKAFDLSGRVVAESTEPEAAAGERVFTRRGDGAYELYMFAEQKP